MILGGIGYLHLEPRRPYNTTFAVLDILRPPTRLDRTEGPVRSLTYYSLPVPDLEPRRPYNLILLLLFISNCCCYILLEYYFIVW